jgi:hypothetical protein
MKYAIPVLAALAIGALAGCDRPSTSGSAGTTTVVKEPVVTKEKDTIVHDSAAPAQPAPSSSTSVNIDASTPAQPPAPSTETTKSTTRVDTPAGTATKTETTRTTQ